MNETSQSLAALRKNYTLGQLSEEDVPKDPIALFETWFAQATRAECPEPNAMVLATANAAGTPSARVVLLKGLSQGDFCFFTNYESQKGIEMEAHPIVAMNFFWKELERQVRITGSVQKIASSESEAYFHSRPVSSQIGAWSSPQSQVIPDRTFLEKLFASNTEKYASGIVPLPSHWGGYIVHPTQMEFWQGRSSRLHDRIRYTLTNNEWIKERLAP